MEPLVSPHGISSALLLPHLGTGTQAEMTVIRKSEVC